MRGRWTTSIAVRVGAGLLVAVIGVACGSGDDDGGSGATGGSSSTAVTTTAPADASASTTTAVAGGPTTTARRGSSATTAAPPTTRPPATAAPRPTALTPAAPGTYRYRTAGAITYTGGMATFPGVTTNRVDPPAGTRQRSSRELKDVNGNGTVVEYSFDYRPDGMYLVSLRLTGSFGGFTDSRDLTPPMPLLFLATGAGPGASRTLDVPVGTAGSARVVVDVLAPERVTVAGQAIDTVVVRSVATFPPGDITGTQSLTVNLDLGSRLWVKERGTTDASAGGGLFVVKSQYEATIESLTPG